MRILNRANLSSGLLSYWDLEVGKLLKTVSCAPVFVSGFVSTHLGCHIICQSLSIPLLSTVSECLEHICLCSLAEQPIRLQWSDGLPKNVEHSERPTYFHSRVFFPCSLFGNYSLLHLYICSSVSLFFCYAIHLYMHHQLPSTICFCHFPKL